MRLIRHPWIWFFRFRKRRGYGVHSPFAFSFITTVINERQPFYAYLELGRLHPWWVRAARLYPVQCRRLLFRLANYEEPKTVRLIGDRPMELAYIRRAVPRALVLLKGVADFVFVSAEQMAQVLQLASQMPENGMLVVEGIHKNHNARQTWQTLQESPHTGVTFDLFTYGVAFFDPHYHKQHYKVNF